MITVRDTFYAKLDSPLDAKSNNVLVSLVTPPRDPIAPINAYIPGVTQRVSG
jgi:hypothetical protein